MSDIPEDLIADVLSRLPVQSLFRFRCVSKQWCALIDSPNFINLQLNQSLKTSNELSVIFEDGNLFSVAFDSLDDILKHDDDILPQSINLIDLKLEYSRIIDSCNGLICLYSNMHAIPILLNPFTKKYQLIPPVSLPSYKYSRFQRFYGFGYDSVNDDYKILRISRYFDDKSVPFHYEVIVYSLRSNIWRMVNCNFPHILVHTIPDLCYGVFFNGAVHWVATRQPNSHVDRFIVAFDLGDENHREVQLPNISGNDIALGVSGGCLFFSCKDEDDWVELWVMKDYMVRESWTKLSIDFLNLYGKFWGEVSILAYSNSSSEVLLTHIDLTLRWLDLKEQKVVDLGILSHGAKICIPSLVKLPCDLRTNVL